MGKQKKLTPFDKQEKNKPLRGTGLRKTPLLVKCFITYVTQSHTHFFDSCSLLSGPPLTQEIKAIKNNKVAPSLVALLDFASKR